MTPSLTSASSIDHMQMTALCRELKLNLDVAYLDGRKADNVDFVQFRDGPEDQTPLTVLYRYVKPPMRNEDYATN